MPLPTHYPIFNNNKQRELGLFTTKAYNVGEKLTKYWGKVHDAKGLLDTEYAWGIGCGKVVDAKNHQCVSKYANSYTTGLFPSNAKMVNKSARNKKTKFCKIYLLLFYVSIVMVIL